MIFVNNAIYGMTGGQMAPTTLQAQKTKTSPYGRNPADVGLPHPRLRAAEHAGGAGLHRALRGEHREERCEDADGPSSRALSNQVDGKGYSFIEVLSMCPTGWGVEPREAAAWVGEAMVPCFPLGTLQGQVGERRVREESSSRVSADRESSSREG